VKFTALGRGLRSNVVRPSRSVRAFLWRRSLDFRPLPPLLRKKTTGSRRLPGKRFFAVFSVEYKGRGPPGVPQGLFGSFREVPFLLSFHGLFLLRRTFLALPRFLLRSLLPLPLMCGLRNSFSHRTFLKPPPRPGPLQLPPRSPFSPLTLWRRCFTCTW